MRCDEAILLDGPDNDAEQSLKSHTWANEKERKPEGAFYSAKN